ncbi:MAG: transcriptional repressor, partial [Oscillospiraceae bacterium]|nr:transcriptional repressor [Oscillospiraceae bacterium]
EWVYSGLKADFPDLSLGTVYRNIAMLKAGGLLRSVGTVSGEERFDGDVSDHTHFVCESCGAVIDIDEGGAAPNTCAEVGKKYGLTVTRRQLTFCGRCPRCPETVSDIEV